MAKQKLVVKDPMSERKIGRPVKSEVVIQNATPAQNPSVENSLSEAVGFAGFPQNQGSWWSEQISQSTTIFKNLRWYLVSNFRQMLSEAYIEIGLIQTICDVPVDDALRGGIEVKSDQLIEDQIKELMVSVDRDDDINTIGQAAKWNRLFGGAGILVLVDDQDPEEPLDLAAITPDTPLLFRAVDMWELFWDKQNTEGYDPTTQTEDFEYYSYYGSKVHKTRVMRIVGKTAPSFIRPRLRGWGFSVVEALVRSINQYLKATDLSFEVLDEFKLDVFKIKNLVNTLLSPTGKQKVQERVALANYQKNYQNAIVMDSEDDFDHKQLSFAGLAEAMAGIRMQVASDMRMPLTKLFGISAAGFNSGEDDIEVYNAMVESEVRNKIKYIIMRVLELKCQKLFGFVPDDLKISFQPLRVMSAEQEQNVKTQKFSRLLQALQAGQLSQQEFREAANKGDLFDISLDPDLVADTGYMADSIDEGENDPYSPQDQANPGADRVDSRKPTATSTGGIGKGEVKPSKEAPSAGAGKSPDAKAAKDSETQKAKVLNAEWDESKHPRRDDGKFGKGAGKPAKAAKGKKSEATPTVKTEMIEVGADGVADLSDEQVALVKERFREAAHGEPGKNPATETPEETSARQHELERKTRERAGKEETPIKRSETITAGDVSKVIAEHRERFEKLKDSNPEVSNAVYEWSRATYRSVMQLQRGEEPDNKELGEKVLNALDANFSKLPPYSGPLTRDLPIDIETALAQFKPGETFTTDTYTSFTARDTYTTRRKMRMVVENSTAGKAVWGVCQDKSEMEVLIPKGVTYQVDRVEEKDDAPYVVVYLKEVKS